MRMTTTAPQTSDTVTGGNNSSSKEKCRCKCRYGDDSNISIIIVLVVVLLGHLGGVSTLIYAGHDLNQRQFDGDSLVSYGVLWLLLPFLVIILRLCCGVNSRKCLGMVFSCLGAEAVYFFLTASKIPRDNVPNVGGNSETVTWILIISAVLITIIPFIVVQVEPCVNRCREVHTMNQADTELQVREISESPEREEEEEETRVVPYVTSDGIFEGVPIAVAHSTNGGGDVPTATYITVGNPKV